MNEGWELRRNLATWLGRASEWHLKHQKDANIEFKTVDTRTVEKLLSLELIYKSKRIDLTTEQYALTEEGRKIAKKEN